MRASVLSLAFLLLSSVQAAPRLIDQNYYNLPNLNASTPCIEITSKFSNQTWHYNIDGKDLYQFRESDDSSINLICTGGSDSKLLEISFNKGAAQRLGVTTEDFKTYALDTNAGFVKNELEAKYGSFSRVFGPNHPQVQNGELTAVRDGNPMYFIFHLYTDYSNGSKTRGVLANITLVYGQKEKKEQRMKLSQDFFNVWKEVSHISWMNYPTKWFYSQWGCLTTIEYDKDGSKYREVIDFSKPLDEVKTKHTPSGTNVRVNSTHDIYREYKDGNLTATLDYASFSGLSANSAIKLKVLMNQLQESCFLF